MAAQIQEFIALFAGGFCIASFSGWFFHLLAHCRFLSLKRTPGLRTLRIFRRFHYTYHHRLYAPRAGFRSRRYLLGRRNCNDTFLPGVVFVVLISIVVADFRSYAPLGAAYAFYVWLTVRLHELYHLEPRGLWVQSQAWFKRARQAHDVHHMTDTVNFGATPPGLVWDWLFGTYAVSVPEAERLRARPWNLARLLGAPPSPRSFIVARLRKKNPA